MFLDVFMPFNKYLVSPLVLSTFLSFEKADKSTFAWFLRTSCCQSKGIPVLGGGVLLHVPFMCWPKARIRLGCCK